MRSPTVRVAAALSLIVALTVGWLAPAAVAAPSEDEPVAPLAVALNTLTPIVPQLKGRLTLTGTVTNTTDSDVGSLSVDLRLGESPITDREELEEISTDAFSPFTRGVTDGTTELASIPAGSTVPWQLSVRMRDLQLTANGVYYLRVDAIADADNTFSASTRTFLPWFPDPDLVLPTEVAWLWPISDWPNRDASGVFLTDRTPTELGQNGRLNTLLELGLSANRKIDWVIDPQVIQSAAVAAGPYQVMGVNGTPVSGGSPGPAASWLTRARAGLPTASVYGWSYANPDVTALTEAKMGEDVIAATTIAPELLTEQLGLEPTDTLGWPIGQRTDREALGVLQRAGVRTVVLKDSALQPGSGGDSGSNTTALIRTDAGPLQAIVTDPVLSRSLGNAQSTPAEALIARQRFLAETGVLATTATTTGAPVVVGPAAQWDPNPATVSGIIEAISTAPWLASIPLAKLIASSDPDTSRSLSPVSHESKRALRRADHLKKVSASQKKLRLFGSIMANQGSLTEPYAAALLRTTSGAWRSEVAESEQLLRIIDDELDADISKVQVIGGGVINISSGAGAIPITIANDLPVPVTVGLTLNGTPKVRLITNDLEPISIPANRKVSTEIDAQVIGNGELAVDVQLTNPAGDPIGKPAEVILRSTAYAQAASWVVGIAFVLLTALLAINSIRRRRQARADRDAKDSPGTDGDSGSGPSSDAGGAPGSDPGTTS